MNRVLKSNEIPKTPVDSERGEVIAWKGVGEWGAKAAYTTLKKLVYFTSLWFSSLYSLRLGIKTEPYPIFELTTARRLRQQATMGPFTLYQHQLSGNCYKVRLTASLLGQKLDIHDIDIFGGETKGTDFKSKINPTGEVPVLQIDNETFLPQSNAAIYYLADISKSDLIPKDSLQHAQMLQWMFWEQYTHEPKVAVRRFLLLFVGEKNLNETQRAKLGPLKEDGEKALDVMEEHLTKQDFFVANRLTLADIALYAYTHVAADGGFDLSKFPNVAAWCDRITRQQGYVPISTPTEP